MHTGGSFHPIHPTKNRANAFAIPIAPFCAFATITCNNIVAKPEAAGVNYQFAFELGNEGAGEVIAMWGQGGNGPGPFDNLHGIVVSLDGTVYVADTANHRIQVFRDRSAQQSATEGG